MIFFKSDDPLQFCAKCSYAHTKLTKLYMTIIKLINHKQKSIVRNNGPYTYINENKTLKDNRTHRNSEKIGKLE